MVGIESSGLGYAPSTVALRATIPGFVKPWEHSHVRSRRGCMNVPVDRMLVRTQMTSFLNPTIIRGNPVAAMHGIKGLSGLGASVFCTELDSVLGDLKTALDMTPKLGPGVAGDPRVSSAVHFWSREVGRKSPLLGEGCKNMVTEGARHVAAVKDYLCEQKIIQCGLLTNIFGNDARAPNISDDGSPLSVFKDLTTTLKFVAVGAAVVAVAVTVWKVAR